MISVIVPVLNEIRHEYLEKVLGSLSMQRGDMELIIVDGGSTDETVARASCYGRVLSLPNSNRAERMHHGASHAKGDVLLFAHPVSILPVDALIAIEEALSDEDVVAGGFSHSFDVDSTILSFASWYANAVRGRRGIMYLDHGFFVRRSAYEAVGGFPPLDIFEDTALPRLLRKHGKIRLLPEKIVTSARRFTKRGIIRHSLMNTLLKAGYNIGIHPNTLNKWYEGKNPFNVSKDRYS